MIFDLTPESLVPTELIYGKLRVADAPMPRHQRVVRDLCFALVEHAEARRLGEVWVSPLDVILDAERALILQPDLFFISNERSHIGRACCRNSIDHSRRCCAGNNGLRLGATVTFRDTPTPRQYPRSRLRRVPRSS